MNDKVKISHDDIKVVRPIVENVTAPSNVITLILSVKVKVEESDTVN